MSRLFTDGAEFGDTLFWDTVVGCAASATQKRSGSYAYYLDGSAGATSCAKNLSAVGEIYVRSGVYIPGTGSGTIMTLRKGTTTIGEILRNALNQLTIYVGGSLVATGTIPVLPATCYLIEWHLKVDNSAGESTIKIDSVADATFSGDTQPGSDTTIDNLYFIAAPGSGPSRYIDDIAINDTAGGADNSWCGDGYVIRLGPNGNGAVNQWTGSDSDSTDNYLLVDEVPDSATDYVEDGTSGHQDMYALADFDGVGKTIRRVWAESRAKNTVADGSTLKMGLRLNGSNYVSAALPLLTSYTRVVAPDYTVNPDDSATWEDSDLDDAQFINETV